MGSADAQVFAAQEMQRQVVVSVPLLGLMVKALAHPVGLMALVGAPFAMLLLDVLLALGATTLVARLREVTTWGEHSDEAEVQLTDEYEQYAEEVSRPGLLARIHAMLRRHKKTTEDTLDAVDGLSVALPNRRHHYGV
jgi:hypothetical protein